MDFVDAIKSHAGWKSRLLNFAKGSTLDRLNPDVAAKDDRCPLGQWLHNEGKAELAGQRYYDELIMVHAAFHLEAAAIARLIESGQTAQARRALEDAQSPFNQASSKVVALMTRLRESFN